MAGESDALVLREGDDVAVARRPIRAGTALHGVAARQDIPPGHKVALRAIPPGAPVRKYGQVIGFASAPIAPGDHVHVHNVEVKSFEREYAFGAEARPLPPAPPRTFMGYLRPDGRVGTRNYVAVISSVNCSASVSRLVAERFRGPDLRREFPNVDGVVAFSPKGGCIEPPGEPKAILRRVMAGFARHPNVSGFVMIGLGCEGNRIDLIREEHGLDAVEPAPAFLSIQGTGGTLRTVEAAAAAVRKLLPSADAPRRTPQAASRLVMALNCGGSDGHSGITANPALGVASDALVRQGGTSVLAETPEIYGAEHLLARRAVSRAVGEKLAGVIRWWEEHLRAHGASFDNNPSPGNREGGLTTIYEKSLGAVAKGGQAPLAAVYRYAEPVEAPGLCFMDTPGYDPVSMTGLVAGGCTVAGFTTGRGSVFGLNPVPCIRIASNTPLFERLGEDMDIDAGTILDGTETVEEVGRRIFEKVLSVAGGERTKGELAGVGDEEFAPWTLGPTF
jgi:altronate dehydratase